MYKAYRAFKSVNDGDLLDFTEMRDNDIKNVIRDIQNKQITQVSAVWLNDRDLPSEILEFLKEKQSQSAIFITYNDTTYQDCFFNKLLFFTSLPNWCELDCFITLQSDHPKRPGGYYTSGDIRTMKKFYEDNKERLKTLPPVDDLYWGSIGYQVKLTESIALTVLTCMLLSLACLLIFTPGALEALLVVPAAAWYGLSAVMLAIGFIGYITWRKDGVSKKMMGSCAAIGVALLLMACYMLAGSSSVALLATIVVAFVLQITGLALCHSKEKMALTSSRWRHVETLNFFILVSTSIAMVYIVVRTTFLQAFVALSLPNPWIGIYVLIVLSFIVFIAAAIRMGQKIESMIHLDQSLMIQNTLASSTASQQNAKKKIFSSQKNGPPIPLPELLNSAQIQDGLPSLAPQITVKQLIRTEIIAFLDHPGDKLDYLIERYDSTKDNKSSPAAMTVAATAALLMSAIKMENTTDAFDVSKLNDIDDGTTMRELLCERLNELNDPTSQHLKIKDCMLEALNSAQTPTLSS